MWECRYRHHLRHDPALQTFVANKRSTTPQRKMSEKELLREVTTGRLFGMLEVDIRVPEVFFGSLLASHHDPLTIFRGNIAVVLHHGDTLLHHRGTHARTREVWSVSKTQTITGGRDESQKLLIATPVKMVPRTRTRSDQNLSSDRIYTSTMFSRIRRRVVRGHTPIQIKPPLVVRPRFLETALSGARSWIKRSFKTFNTSKETTERCFKPTYYNSKNWPPSWTKKNTTR